MYFKKHLYTSKQIIYVHRHENKLIFLSTLYKLHIAYLHAVLIYLYHNHLHLAKKNPLVSSIKPMS